jgi:transposase
MRRIRDCLRLYLENNLNQTQIAQTLGIARSTVQDYLSRATINKITDFSQVQSISDTDLENLFFQSSTDISVSTDKNSGLDYEYLHNDLQRPGVTLRLLWEEYRKTNPEGYQYSQFCWHFQQWRQKLKVYMRQTHIAGERIYVDYSGKKPSIVDRLTGEIQEVELLVMCWGCSHYTYAEAQPSQALKYWIMGHVRGFDYFGCVSKLLVPDNLKSGVTKAHRYDPDVNPTYTELSEHYGFGVLPARPNHPRDKAKVETSVQIVQRWIVARLRNQVFHSIEDLNRAIWVLLTELNSRPLQKLHRSRKELFDELDKPNALKLPQQQFTYRQWYTPTINLDYHIEIEKRYYSVPWSYYGKKIQACLSEGTLSVFHAEKRIAIHEEQKKPYTYATSAEHMPPNHKNYSDWSLAVVLRKAREVGPATECLIKKIIDQKQHPQQGYRPAQGILRLAPTYGNDRLEAAASIAATFGFNRVEQIASMLKNGKDRPVEESVGTVDNVNNVRGQNYYTQKEGNI